MIGYPLIYKLNPVLQARREPDDVSNHGLVQRCPLNPPLGIIPTCAEIAVY